MLFLSQNNNYSTVIVVLRQKKWPKSILSSCAASELILCSVLKISCWDLFLTFQESSYRPNSADAVVQITHIASSYIWAINPEVHVSCLVFSYDSMSWSIKGRLLQGEKWVWARYIDHCIVNIVLWLISQFLTFVLKGRLLQIETGLTFFGSV